MTAVAKGMSALRQLVQPEDGSPPAASAIMQEATAAVPQDSCAAVQTLMDIDESIVKPQPAATPAKVWTATCKGRRQRSNQLMCAESMPRRPVLDRLWACMLTSLI